MQCGGAHAHAAADYRAHCADTLSEADFSVEEDRPRQLTSRLATTANPQCAGPTSRLLTERAARAVSAQSRMTAVKAAIRAVSRRGIEPETGRKLGRSQCNAAARAHAAADYRACCATTLATESSSRQRTLLCLHGTRRFPLPPLPLLFRASQVKSLQIIPNQRAS